MPDTAISGVELRVCGRREFDEALATVKLHHWQPLEPYLPTAAERAVGVDQTLGNLALGLSILILLLH